jgi:hypothetical protein
MMMSRRAVARTVPSFGRRATLFTQGDEQQSSSQLADDVRLFALTFAGGFLFVSVYLA